VPEGVQDAYDEWHGRYEVDEKADAPWHLLIQRMLPPLGGMRVLEIACGRGGFAAWLASRPEGARPGALVAADFSKVALEKAERFGRGLGLRDVTYEQADLTSLHWPDASFDAVISCETLEHLPEPRLGLREIHRVLKPGGHAYLSCPNYLNLTGLHRVYRQATGRLELSEHQPIDHPLLLPRVLRWLRAAGLRVERVEGSGHYLPFPRRPPIRLPLLDRLPAQRWTALHVAVAARKEPPG
jgi:ubiquinone/menaquinone biosynthesis C-methylase UbiE